jgi:hypothetical protein
MDGRVAESLRWVRDDDPDGTEIMFLFSYGEAQDRIDIPLVADGEDKAVTNANKEDYLRLMIQGRLKDFVAHRLKAFCEGFYSIIPPETIKIFTPAELDLLICGLPKIDVEDWKRNCVCTLPYTMNHPVIEMFFEQIAKWRQEDLGKLLEFITGSSRVPTTGFSWFADMGIPIQIAPGGEGQRLPVAHTCFHMLQLPEYQQENDFDYYMKCAIRECSSFELP